MRKQSGSLLLEYMLVVVLLTVMAIWTVEHMQRQMREQLVSTGLSWGLQLREAVQDYLHALSIMRAKQSDWQVSWPYADWRSPRLDELQTQGLLSLAFPMQSVLGNMRVHVHETSPCESQSCRVDALLVMLPFAGFTWLSQPYYQTLWKLQSQGYGVSVTSPETGFSGPGGQWPNPLYADLLALPVGSVGLSVFKNNKRTEDFLSVGDARDPSFNGSLTVREAISSQGDLHTKQALRIDGQARYRAACDTEQAIMRDSAGAGLLVCQKGRWQLMGGGSGGAYSQHTLYGCNAGPPDLSQKNPVTGRCDCPPDHVALLMAESAVQGGVRRSYLCYR